MGLTEVLAIIALTGAFGLSGVVWLASFAAVAAAQCLPAVTPPSQSDQFPLVWSMAASAMRFTITVAHNLLNDPNVAMPYPLVAAQLN